MAPIRSQGFKKHCERLSVIYQHIYFYQQIDQYKTTMGMIMLSD